MSEIKFNSFNCEIKREKVKTELNGEEDFTYFDVLYVSINNSGILKYRIVADKRYPDFSL